MQEASPRTHEKVAGRSREHDRGARRVDPLIAKRGSGFAHALPRFAQVVGQMLGQRGFGRRPAIVRLALLDPLRRVIRSEWSGLTRERHRKLLIQDFLEPDEENRRIGAYLRLAYYYPDSVEDLVIKQLAAEADPQFIAALVHDHSSKVDAAVHEIFLGAGDDRYLAAACFARLIGRGYDDEIAAYCREHVFSESEISETLQEFLNQRNVPRQPHD